MVNKKLKLFLFPAMVALLSLTGCGEKKVGPGTDELGFIPDSVRGYNGDIDVYSILKGKMVKFLTLEMRCIQKKN